MGVEAATPRYVFDSSFTIFDESQFAVTYFCSSEAIEGVIDSTSLVHALMLSLFNLKSTYVPIYRLLNTEDEEERDELTERWKDNKLQELNFVGIVVSSPLSSTKRPSPYFCTAILRWLRWYLSDFQRVHYTRYLMYNDLLESI